MSTQNQKLKEAKAAFDKQDWVGVLSCANDVLEYDEQNYHALVFKGVAVFNLALLDLREKTQPRSRPSTTKKLDDSLDKSGLTFINAIAAFNAAIKVNNGYPAGWQGLAEVYTALLPFRDDVALPSSSSSYSKPLIEAITTAPTKLIEIYTSLLKLTPSDQPATSAKHSSFLMKLADAQFESGLLLAARQTLSALLTRLDDKNSVPSSGMDHPTQMKINVYSRLASVLEKIALTFQKQKTKPSASSSSTPLPEVNLIEGDSATASNELIQVLKVLIDLLVSSPSTPVRELLSTKIKYLNALELKLSNSSSSRDQAAVDLAVFSKELLATPEGRSFSPQPYEVLLRLYDQSRPPPGTRMRPSWQSSVNCLLSRNYMERCVALECYRRFPNRPLSYLHFLHSTRPKWIHDSDARDSAREWILRVLTTTQTPDIKIPSLLLLARIHRKVNQLGPVVETCKSLLELIKEQQVGDAEEPLYPVYWTESMLLLAEALVRSRQYDAGQAAFSTILKREPTNVPAARGLAELLYQKRQLRLSQAEFESAHKSHPSQLWFKARLAWIDALPFLQWLEARPDFDAEKCDNESLLQDREPLMFRAISAKNALISVIEIEMQQLQSRSREMSSQISRYQSREEAQADTEMIGSYSLSDHVVCFDSDDLCSKYGFGFGWYEYWLGSIEWALGDQLAARDCWIRSAKWSAPAPIPSDEGSSVAEPAALAALGKFHLHLHKKRGIESDLSTAQACFEAALRKFPLQRMRRTFLHEGKGDGLMLLEAALPLLDILLDTAFVKKLGAPASSLDSIVPDDADNDLTEERAVVDKRAYSAAMALLSQLSQGKHHWALLKLGLCRMRSGEFNLAVASLQNYLRREPSDVNGWLALAHSYRRQGKWLAAVKVAERVEAIFRQTDKLSSDPHALIKSQYLVGATLLKLGFIDSAIRLLSAVAKQSNQAGGTPYITVMAILNLLAAYQHRCLDEMRVGRYASAKQTLHDATLLADELQSPILQPLSSPLLLTWKIIGDIHTLFYRVHDIATTSDGSQTISQLRSQTLRRLRAGSRAYLRAIQIDRESHALYHDLSVNYVFQAQILTKLAATRGSETTSDPDDASSHLSYLPRPNEHLSMFDEALTQIDRAAAAAPHFVPSPGAALHTGLPLMKYLTVKGIVLSQYQRALDCSPDPIPPTLLHVPASGYNEAQRCLNSAVGLSSRMAASSDGYFGGASATYAWSNMLAHWINSNAPRDTVAATAQYARNLNPIDPVPWTALVWALTETFSDSDKPSSTFKSLLREEMNALVHAIQLSPNLDFAVVILSRLVFVLQRADLDSGGTSSQALNTKQLAVNLLRQVSVHLERYSHRHGGSLASDMGAVHNLIGCILMRIQMYSAATSHFQAAHSAHLGASKRVVVALNLALALERSGDFRGALGLYEQLQKESNISASPEMMSAVGIGMFRALLMIQPTRALEHLNSLTPKIESPLFTVWRAKALYRLNVLTDLSKTALSGIRLCTAPLGSQDPDLALAALDQALSASSSGAALAVLTADRHLFVDAVEHLAKIADICSSRISKLQLTPPSTGASVEVLQSHQLTAAKARSLLQRQYQAIYQRRDISHADSMLANLPAQASAELLRSVHSCPWRAEPWLKLASNYSITHTDGSFHQTSTQFLRDIPLLRRENDVFVRNPVDDLHLRLQDCAVRVARLLSTGCDPCPGATADSYPDTVVENVARASAAPSWAQDVVVAASRAVHLSPWIESSWILLSSAVGQVDSACASESQAALAAAQVVAVRRRSSPALFPWSDASSARQPPHGLKIARQSSWQDPKSCIRAYEPVIRSAWNNLDPHLLLAAVVELAAVLQENGKPHSAGLVLKLAQDIILSRKQAMASEPLAPVLEDASSTLLLHRAHLLYRSQQFVVGSQLLDQLAEKLQGRPPIAIVSALQAAFHTQLGKKAKVTAALEKLKHLNPGLLESLFN